MILDMVSVEITPEAAAQVEALPSPIVRRMRKLIGRLQHWPAVSGVKHLTGDLAGKCRLRTGDYRMQFRVERTRKTVQVKRVVKGKEVVQEQEVVDYRVIVEKAGHRDGFYDE
jgi:mRNA-degrading endonuclease RelE of RelBE toxin-antitoxin system